MSVSCKKKKKKGSASSGRISSRASLLLGPSGTNSAHLLLFSFLFSFPRLTAWAHVSASPGSRAASSRSGVNSSACVRVCVLCVQSRLATPRTQRRGVGAATAHRRRDGNSATRLCFDVQASKAPPWLGCERAQVRRGQGRSRPISYARAPARPWRGDGGPAAAWSGDSGGLQC